MTLGIIIDPCALKQIDKLTEVEDCSVLLSTVLDRMDFPEWLFMFGLAWDSFRNSRFWRDRILRLEVNSLLSAEERIWRQRVQQ